MEDPKKGPQWVDFDRIKKDPSKSANEQPINHWTHALSFVVGLTLKEKLRRPECDWAWCIKLAERRLEKGIEKDMRYGKLSWKSLQDGKGVTYRK